MSDTSSDTGKSKKFRLSNKRLHLTYKTHLVFIDWLKWIGGKYPKIKVDKYSMVHENGSEGAYPHTHILVSFNDVFTSSSEKCLDFTGIHPQIKKISGDDHWNNTIIYHKKEGTPYTNLEFDIDAFKRNGEKLLEEENKKKQVAFGYEDIRQLKDSNSSISDAYKMLIPNNGISKIGAIKMAWESMPVNYGTEPKVSWRPWQNELLDEIKEKCTDDRSIIWYTDKVGNSGKTVFAKHMVKYYGVFVATHCNAYHIATTLHDRYAQGNPINCVIINLTRTQEDSGRSLYEGLELLKDGLVTSKKYKGTTLVFDSPHVVVFSNFAPQFHYISLDRWKIRNLNSEFKADPVLVPGIQTRLSPRLPFGFHKPGVSIPVAEPDEIIRG